MEETRASESGEKIILKFIMIGNASVGKTSLMTRYFDDSWGNDNLPPTLSVSQKYKNLQILGRTVKLQVFDTAG